jgi:CFEM domain
MVTSNISAVFTVVLIASLFHFRAEHFLKLVQALRQKNQPLEEPPQCFCNCAEAIFPCEAMDSACICDFVFLGVVEVMGRCIDSLCEGPDRATALSWMDSTCEEQLGTLDNPHTLS